MPAATASLVLLCSTMGMEMVIIQRRGTWLMVPDKVSAIKEARVIR